MSSLRAMETPSLPRSLTTAPASPVFPRRPAPFGDPAALERRVVKAIVSQPAKPSLAPALAELKQLLQEQGLRVTENGLMDGKVSTLTAARDSYSATPLIGVSTCHERRFSIVGNGTPNDPTRVHISVRPDALETDASWARGVIASYLVNQRSSHAQSNTVPAPHSSLLTAVKILSAA